jgi:hypothetical protein
LAVTRHPVESQVSCPKPSVSAAATSPPRPHVRDRPSRNPEHSASSYCGRDDLKGQGQIYWRQGRHGVASTGDASRSEPTSRLANSLANAVAGSWPHDRPGAGPGLSCWFWGGAPRRNRTGDPILTMEPPGTAVRTAIPPGHARPLGPQLWVLLRRRDALTFRSRSSRERQQSRRAHRTASVFFGGGSGTVSRRRLRFLTLSRTSGMMRAPCSAGSGRAQSRGAYGLPS